MFYYPNVLHRHTGCFSTVWLAATKGIRITRREFLRVNVGKTCEDIMDYVQVQVPPLHPSLPRPRFSLYLSSQLQYGVVIVYHRQCAFLLEEVQNTIERFLRSERHSQIDIQELDRLALDIPDSLLLLEEAEGALEPFFGIMGVECELHTPCQIPQPWQVMETSPARPHHLVTSKKNTIPIGLTVSPETITITDTEPVRFPVAEFGGVELPEATAQEIDTLLQQEDLFPLTGEVEDREREREGERWREGEAAMISTEQLTETAIEDKSLVMEDTEHPMEVVKQIVAMEKTPPPLTFPSTRESSEKDLEQNKDTECSSSEIPVPEGGALPESRQRKRQLIFADQHTQISQEAMQKQISNSLAETHALSAVLLQVPSLRRFSSADLLSSPCNSFTKVLPSVLPCLDRTDVNPILRTTPAFLHPDLTLLWKQHCFSATLPPLAERRPLQEDSEPPGTEIVRPEEDRQWRMSGFSREVLRESSDVGLLLSEVSGASDVLLDESKGDKSQSDLITPISRRSPMEEGAVYMEAILEECVELPQVDTMPETGEITPYSLLRMLNTYIDRFGKVSFHSLLPPEADRSIAAHMFYRVLELVCLKKLWVRQTEPYGLITFRNGPW